jgi:hypothetical protein
MDRHRDARWRAECVWYDAGGTVGKELTYGGPSYVAFRRSRTPSSSSRWADPGQAGRGLCGVTRVCKAEHQYDFARE